MKLFTSSIPTVSPFNACSWLFFRRATNASFASTICMLMISFLLQNYAFLFASQTLSKENSPISTIFDVETCAK